MDYEEHLVVHRGPAGQQLVCWDCEGCHAECDHSEHGVRLREGNAVHHTALTGHGRCHPAGELRPTTDCRVSLPSLAYSSLYGNKVGNQLKIFTKHFTC